MTYIETSGTKKLSLAFAVCNSLIHGHGDFKKRLEPYGNPREVIEATIDTLIEKTIFMSS
jgi:hypothetical protein